MTELTHLAELVDCDRAEQALLETAAGLATASGETFFASLLAFLCRALDVEIGLVGSLKEPGGTSIQTLALVKDGQPQENINYDLANTPCERVIGRRVCSFPEGVAQLFPRDVLLASLGAVSYAGCPLFDSNGQSSGLIVVLSRRPMRRTDLIEATLEVFAARASAEMERKKTLDQLRQRESFYRSLLDSGFEGTCSLDSTGRCTLWSARAADILGYTEEELLGRNFHTMIHPSGQCPSNCWMTQFEAGKIRHTGEDIFINKNGRSVPVEIAASLINGQVEEGIVISFLELTDKRHLQAQLEQARRIHGLGQLAASVAHEFNNVLMGIQPFAETISRFASDEPRLGSAAAHIVKSVTRGRRVTEEILRFARPSSPVLKPVRLRGLIDDIRLEIDERLGDRVNLQFDVEDDALHVLGDAAQLEQVFMNLVGNARDAMPAGGTLRITMQAGVSYQDLFPIQTPDRYVHIRFTDTGVGISQDSLEHIFEPLYTTKVSGRGTGLGLAIAHQIIRLHQGLIFAESQVGKGTTFHLFIPAALPPIHGVEEADVTLPPQRLLLIEDERPIAEGLAALLESEAHEVKVVGEGLKALVVIESFAPTALILDVGLPDIDGFNLYEQIAVRWPDLPVVFSTGHGDQSRLERYMDRPNVGFLLKPYEMEALGEMLSRVMGYRV